MRTQQMRSARHRGMPLSLTLRHLELDGDTSACAILRLVGLPAPSSKRRGSFLS